MYSKDQIKQAETIDIVDYCYQNNIALKGDTERYYRLVDHDSCVIDRKKNNFYWNSRGKNGNIINFVQEYEGIKFKEAMERLLDENNEYQNMNSVKFVVEPYEYSSEKEVEKFDKAREYLIKERKIDPEIVNDLHNRGLIKQDIHNNVLFLWKDYEKVMGCSEQGTFHSDKFKRGSWKSIQKNSTANYGFNVQYGEPKHLKYFEASIDMLSYATLNKENLKDTWLISMEGLKHNTVLNYVLKAKAQLKDTPDSVTLCVDNDKGGNNFCENLSMIKIKRKDGSMFDIENELPTLKDWNDDLKQQKKGQMELNRKMFQKSRLFER